MKMIVTIKQAVLPALSLASLLIFSMSGCNDNQSKEGSNGQDSTATITASATAAITGTTPDTAVSGTARFTTNGDKVKMTLQLSIPSKANKSVAVHLHENGNCGDTAKAAGSHWNPTNASHGKWGSSSFHSGDIGNVSLDASGSGSIEIETELWSIGGAPTKDILNKSVIVHGGVDDFTTQPTGNSGGRIGCGVIGKGE